MSKLYTEEQLRAIYIKGVCNGIMRIEGKSSDEIRLLTPIQLPTDEEVYELAKEQYPISMEKFGNEMMDGNIYFRSIFIQGAEWMRDKIKGGGDE